MKLNRESVAIHFGDLREGTSIISPTQRTLHGDVVFDAGRMLQVEGHSSDVDETGKPLIKICMGRAVETVPASDVIITSEHLPRWQQILLPTLCKRRLLMKRLLEGAMSPWEERQRKNYNI